MELTTTTCDCCNADTHHIRLPIELVSMEDGELSLHLDSDELMDLYQECKRVVCQ